MADVINFSLERAKRKSGMKDTSVLQDMIDQGYDPCDPKQIQEYQLRIVALKKIYLFGMNII